jgi:hypothetical protein
VVFLCPNHGRATKITADQIRTRIDEVDDAIGAVLLGQTYSLDTGHGRQSVTRASIGQLRQLRAELVRMLSMSGDPYVTSGEVRR